jgi:hypothetical protein
MVCVDFAGFEVMQCTSWVSMLNMKNTYKSACYLSEYFSILPSLTALKILRILLAAVGSDVVAWSISDTFNQILQRNAHLNRLALALGLWAGLLLGWEQITVAKLRLLDRPIAQLLISPCIDRFNLQSIAAIGYVSTKAKKLTMAS